MPEQTDDLWPRDFTTMVDDPAPAVLLKQQARLLSGKTAGRVEGVVRESTVEGTVFYSLYLRSRVLGESMFKVLYIALAVTRDPASPFPLTVNDSCAALETKVNDMDEFREWLRSVLSSEGVGAVIGNLIKNSERTVASQST